MLMLTGVVVEITDRGPQHMALFTSARVPGNHFKVQIDAITATKLRSLINVETFSADQASQMASQFFGAPDDEEEPQHDSPFGRN